MYIDKHFMMILTVILMRLMQFTDKINVVFFLM